MSHPQNVLLRLVEVLGLPIVGRVHDIDMKRSWFKFKEWADLYGPIYKTTMMGATHVWISDGQIAAELLSRRADIYSDRPGIPHMPGTKDGVEYLPFLRYGGMLREAIPAFRPESD